MISLVVLYKLAKIYKRKVKFGLLLFLIVLKKAMFLSDGV